MQPRLSALLACVLAIVALPLRAEGPSTRQLLAAMRQPNELGRYCYLLQTIPRLGPVNTPLAQQYFAFSESELGLYGEAVRDFPLKGHLPADIVTPTSPAWAAVDAVAAIVDLASDRRVVMVNEAHHDPHTRLLTLALLPRLRAIGYTHLAIEALVEDGDSLRRRGYPTGDSGTEYLREPVYGQIVREALRLGYILVPYDPQSQGADDRESLQARTLYRQVLAGNPHARLLVHAGYAHIDKARGRLGSALPMAARLQALSGLEVLSIDQTDVREDEPFNELEAYRVVRNAVRTGESLHGTPQNGLSPRLDTRTPQGDLYHRIVASYRPERPIVLRHVGDGRLWSARPALYDMSVILPPANERVSAYVRNRVISLHLGDNTSVIALPPAADGYRPDWLSLGGTRLPLAIDQALCAGVLPCLVEAHYAGEPDQAVAADRYVFLEGSAGNTLWLRPGTYRLRAVGAQGKVLGERAVRVDAQP